MNILIYDLDLSDFPYFKELVSKFKNTIFLANSIKDVVKIDTDYQIDLALLNSKFLEDGNEAFKKLNIPKIYYFGNTSIKNTNMIIYPTISEELLKQLTIKPKTNTKLEEK